MKWSAFLSQQKLAVAITFQEGGKVFAYTTKLITHGLPGVVVVGFEVVLFRFGVGVGVGATGKETFGKIRVTFVEVDKNEK